MSQAVTSISVAADAIVREAVADAERLRAAGAPRESALRALVDAAEQIAGDDVVASILVLDEDGLLRNGASPNLPPDFLAAIDRLRPDPCVGTCAAAAATGNLVLTPDFLADDKWAELRHLPNALGFVGAWSMPIKTPDGTVLGTFGTYLRANRLPTPAEQEAVGHLAAQAARVLLSRPPR